MVVFSKPLLHKAPSQQDLLTLLDRIKPKHLNEELLTNSCLPMSSFSLSASGADTVLSSNLGTTINNTRFKNTTKGTEADKFFGNWYSAIINLSSKIDGSLLLLILPTKQETKQKCLTSQVVLLSCLGAGRKMNLPKDINSLCIPSDYQVRPRQLQPYLGYTS